MDLVSIFRSRIDGLTDGDYSTGLKAVLRHVEMAVRHHETGREVREESLFTDAIYRTNQAFEGSLKEAYRVLAGRKLGRITPNEIERFFDTNSILRPRVLAQLSNYRTNWRNVSTHDHKVDFDEDEALLAIVTVTAFAIVLTDQIAERVAFDTAKKLTIQETAAAPNAPLIERAATLISSFVERFTSIRGQNPNSRDAEIIGAMSGFISKAAPDLIDKREAATSYGALPLADLQLSDGVDQVLVEIKRMTGSGGKKHKDAVEQLKNYMGIYGANNGVLLFYPPFNSRKVVRTEVDGLRPDWRIVVMEVE
jgi:hypothetical protein